MQPENKDKPGLAGLYIHVPFCVRKCLYCDFYSVTDLDRTGAFVDGLRKEMDLTEDPGLEFDTIYLGGGTPSLLKPSHVRNMIESANRRFSFSEDVEITLETNPGSMSSDSLKAFLGCGINRFNLGIQSFDDARLGFLGRPHSALDARQAIRLVRKAGVENLGLDLMYGIPGQTYQDWLKDLKEAASYEPEHLSCYMLTYEKETPLNHQREDGRFVPLGESAVRDLFELTIRFLEEAGYEQYEISNFSQGHAFRSRHNQKYWNHTPYIGLGPSAHSFVEPKRSWNHGNLEMYLHALRRGEPPVEDWEVLEQGQLMLESVFLGLRTSHGIDMSQFKGKYGVDFLDHFAPVFERLKVQNLLHCLSFSPNRCALTMEGRVFADAISAVFAE
jgi:oxygen-independent coproporphyrinogen-3 oxidase